MDRFKKPFDYFIPSSTFLKKIFKLILDLLIWKVWGFWRQKNSVILSLRHKNNNNFTSATQKIQVWSCMWKLSGNELVFLGPFQKKILTFIITIKKFIRRLIFKVTAKFVSKQYAINSEENIFSLNWILRVLIVKKRSWLMVRFSIGPNPEKSNNLSKHLSSCHLIVLQTNGPWLEIRTAAGVWVSLLLRSVSTGYN